MIVCVFSEKRVSFMIVGKKVNGKMSKEKVKGKGQRQKRLLF